MQAQQVTKAFTADGSSDVISVEPGGVLGFSTSGTFTGIVALEEAAAGEGAWVVRAQGASSGAQLAGSIKNDTGNSMRFRFRMAGQVSGTCTAVGAGGRSLRVGESTSFVLPANLSTGADTNLVDIPGCSFMFEPGGVYQLSITAIAQAPAATTGLGIAVTVSHAVTKIAATYVHQLANAGTLTGASQIASAAAVGVSSGVPTINTDVPVMGMGLLVAGASAGAAKFQLRSEVAAVVTLIAGSTFTVRRVR